ncbi:MAG: Gldg family protein, partial [Geminicoccaceae bacterium]|nr:Gldg family protein [Geminicoccaceae bacterium]
AVVFVIALLVNFLVGRMNVRADLTEYNVYTLSEGTEATLQAIDEPIDLRFYYSSLLDELGPYFSTHAQRIDELLETYAELSDGKIRVERLDPEPFSPEEDLAVAEGLQGLPLGDDGSEAYFGLAGRNLTDDIEVLPLLAPERADLLEYDLTRIIYDLANPEKPVVAVLGDLPLMGSQANQWQAWLVLDAMFQFFEVRFLGGAHERIDDDVDVLMLAQPKKLDQQSLYAIDQFVMRGGPVMALLDPVAEAMDAAPNPFAGADDPIALMKPLLDAWGVEMAPGRWIGDVRTAQRVQAEVRGRQTIVPYLPWLTLDRPRVAEGDPVTAELERITLASAGALAAREGAATSFEPLLTSSPEAMAFEASLLAGPPDPEQLLRRFEPRGESFVLAARVSGEVGTAFPDGPPEEADATLAENHRSEAEGPLNLILIGDTDLLADQSWVRTQALAGQEVVLPVAHNADFTVNALDHLAGSQALIELRGRGLSVRPFEVVERMEQEAELRFRAKEQELLQSIDATAEKIRVLQEEEQQGGVILTGEQQAEIDRFRTEMIRLRQELRSVQRSLREEVEALAFWIRVINIWAIPILIGLVALGLAVFRRTRAGRLADRPIEGRSG